MACGQVLALCPGDSPSTLLSTLFDVRRRVSQSQREYAVDYRCQASRTPLGETVKPAITRKACTGLHDIVNCESASYRRPIRRTIIEGRGDSRCTDSMRIELLRSALQRCRSPAAHMTNSSNRRKPSKRSGPRSKTSCNDATI